MEIFVWLPEYGLIMDGHVHILVNEGEADIHYDRNMNQTKFSIFYSLSHALFLSLKTLFPVKFMIAFDSYDISSHQTFRLTHKRGRGVNMLPSCRFLSLQACWWTHTHWAYFNLCSFCGSWVTFENDVLRKTTPIVSDKLVVCFAASPFNSIFALRAFKVRALSDNQLTDMAAVIRV